MEAGPEGPSKPWESLPIPSLPAGKPGAPAEGVVAVQLGLWPPVQHWRAGGRGKTEKEGPSETSLRLPRAPPSPATGQHSGLTGTSGGGETPAETSPDSPTLPPEG